MASKRKRLTWGFYGVLSVFLIAYLVFYAYTENKRQDALAKIQKPASTVFYERLIAKRNGIPLDGPIANEDVEGTPYAGLSDIEIEERLDMWGGLLERYDSELAPDEEWRAAAEILKKPTEALTSDEWALLARQASTHEDLILTICTAAEHGGPVHPLNYPLQAEMDITHLRLMREFSRLLSVHARVRGKEEKYDEAEQDIVSMLNLARALNGEDLVINALLRITVRTFALKTIVDSFDAQKMPSEIVNRLFQHLSIPTDRSQFCEALKGEAFTGLSQIEQLRTSMWRSFRAPFRIPLTSLDESMYVTQMDEAIRAAVLPHYARAEKWQSLDSDFLESLGSTNVFTIILIPILPRVFQAQARLEAHNDVTRLGIVIEDWYRGNGSYPDSLHEIAYWFDGELPVDPFTGDAYRYVVSEDSFVLYSLGTDREDDGGRHDLTDGDLVWRGVEDTN